MKKQKSRERLIIIIFTLGCGISIFFNLWARSLENHGYLRYAEVAREMIRSGEWVVPHLNGEIFIDKPPLLFWLIAIPSSLYGSVTPFLARLPSAFSAWIGVIALFFWTKKIYGTVQSGLIASGVLLSSYQYFFQSRLAKTDILLCLFTILSLYLFHLGYIKSERKSYLFYGFSFFFMGLGVLTKGPFGLIPLGVITLFLIKEKRFHILIEKKFLFGYFVLLLTILPWFILFVSRIGFKEWVGLLKENQILTRKAPIYFYLIEIWGQFFPWSILLPFVFYYLWRKKDRLLRSKTSLFIIWFLGLFIFLTLFKYRASRYLLPALPPLALMIGGIWKRKVLYFLIIIISFISFWHIREISWIKKDLYYSPGMVLARDLKPLIKESTLFGYRLDKATLEEINFYLDRIIPILVGIGPTQNPSEQTKEILVLMPKQIYEELQQRGIFLSLIKEFTYKEYKSGKLVLVSANLQEVFLK